MSAAALQDVQSAPLALIGSARAGRRTLLDMLLSAKGYEIAIREDGPAVLEFLKENQPAIAIFDHDLPGMDGREICSRMRFITRLAETPIAIVTPSLEEMGGVNEFENFTDTTTADIVEAEPLGKKKLVERLENVIRDQKGAANDGKMTIAIPTLVPHMPEFEAATTADRGNLDVFVDDDVDIEVDVARAIYSNDASFEQRIEQEPVVSETVAAIDSDRQVGETAARIDTSADETAALGDEPAAEYGEDMFLTDLVDPVEEGNDANDFDLFADEGVSVTASTSAAEADWPEALVANEAESIEPEPIERDAGLVGVSSDTGSEIEVSAEESGPRDTLVELVTDADDRSFSKPTNAGSVAELVEQPAEQSVEEPKADTFHSVPEADGQSVEEAYDQYVAESDDPTKAEQFAAVPQNDSAMESEQLAEAENAPALDDSEQDDLTATIEAAIEAVNLAAMEEAELRAAEAAAQERAAFDEAGEKEFARPEDRAYPAAPAAASGEVEIDVKATVEMIVENAQLLDGNGGAPEAAEAEPALWADPEADYGVELPEVTVPVRPELEVMPAIAAQTGELERHETLDAGANNYADDSNENRIESPSAEADGLEEGDPAVSSGEQYNMQALIAEQAERIDSLQERNVVLRQELEQLKADDAMRHEERSNLQALIKEQTEAITNLQQRNVQLRQELEQFKAEESKRESERAFLQSHTSEQAETIAKLQQLNALLRQELEQRKADEAPLRDFLQRLLDRDEQSSAYQEAMRKEIISLTRDNS